MISIDSAKEIIKNTIKVYLQKNDEGNYELPIERQRPIFLIGAPGIGKTEIVKQVAEELQLGFVSYTMTHHTRQTALGLPMIVEKSINGETYSATEYTMSEIIDSIYTVIKEENKTEGVLFIDEINCVSETLSPLMLDLLQNKRFGSHNLPKGWVLISAGNPTEYNAAARVFDIATSDRLKTIKVTANTEEWLVHARLKKVHPSITYYLKLNSDKLFCVSRKERNLSIVTPRGWEDLSKMVISYEKMGFPVTEELCLEYIQDEEIAKDFFTKYCYFNEYANEKEVKSILEGKGGDFGKIKNANFDEKAALVEILIKEVNISCEKLNKYEMTAKLVLDICSKAKEGDIEKYVEKLKAKNPLKNKKSMDEKLNLDKALIAIEEKEGDNLYTKARNYVVDYKKMIDNVENQIQNASNFIIENFGEGEEILTFLLGLLKCVAFNQYLIKNKSQAVGKIQKYFDEDLMREEILSMIESVE